MPPISPQGSRGGLITAVVIFTILFVTSTIFAIYYAVQNGKTEEKLAARDTASKSIYVDISNARIAELKKEAAAPNAGLYERTVLAAAINDTLNASKLIAGSGVSTVQPSADAAAKAKDVLDDLKKKYPTIPDDNLLDAMKALAGMVDSEHASAAEANANEKKAETDFSSKVADVGTQLTAKIKADEESLKKMTAAHDDAEKAKNDYMQKATDQLASFEKERTSFNGQLAAAENVKQDLERKWHATEKQRDQVIERLRKIRFVNPEDVVVRKPDGMILTVAADNIVYINLGVGDHIVPGLTFEVYSKADGGVPPLGDGMSDLDMPIGVASIEVQQINGASSQCRVTKLQPGQHINQGDLIANLVYDRNVKFSFVVFGKFDLSQGGHPNLADADVIKSLVVQWGGKVQKDVNVDTDFLVMGSEPVVAPLTDDQKNDPFAVANNKAEQAAFDAYQAVVGQAKDLHIPIMNQNRFLYFSGYYDLAAR